MRAVIVTESEFKALSKLKQNVLSKANKKFLDRKSQHCKNPYFREFLAKCTTDYNPVMHTIPFRCYFSLYLYLYLKSKIERLERDIDRYQFRVSKPITINFTQIGKLSGVSINTVKSAFAELKQFKLLVFTDVLTDHLHNVSKTAMLVNDFYLVSYDSQTNEPYFYTQKHTQC